MAQDAGPGLTGDLFYIEFNSSEIHYLGLIFNSKGIAVNFKELLSFCQMKNVYLKKLITQLHGIK